MTRRRGTCVLIGLPPGEFPVPLFDVVASCVTIRGSFVGTRQDMAEALAFAAEGKVKADIELQPLSSINQIFGRREHGDVASRVVLCGLGPVHAARCRCVAASKSWDGAPQRAASSFHVEAERRHMKAFSARPPFVLRRCCQIRRHHTSTGGRPPNSAGCRLYLPHVHQVHIR